nr:gamma-glutamyl-gamma-aminobutyrate hydrolase family protein [Swingsia samuiensis]
MSAIRPPLIGLTLDLDSGGEGKFSRYPYHALRENYLTAVSEAGGIPVCLGYDTKNINHIIQHLDGLIITGGDFDVDPQLYNEAPHPRTKPFPKRTTAERALLQHALHKDIPILGICGGMQLLAVEAGGSLIQHLDPALGHEQPNPRHEVGHPISVLPNTYLSKIVQSSQMSVNSSHHQAVKNSGSARISALAPDGTIEAIELIEKRFAIGVQWHPEFTLDPGDRRLYTALIEAAAP